MNSKQLSLRRTQFIGTSVLGIAVIFAVARAQPANDGAKKSTPDLAGLAWLEGRWRTEVGGDQLEEVWSAPLGDSIVGTFRWVKGGKVWMCELLTIIADGDDVVFRLKHFDNKMVGWEEKDQSLNWKLVRGGPDEWVFENPSQGQATRLTYRKAGKDEMLVRLEVEHDGKASTKEFKFRR